MFEAYAIGVTLRLNNLISPQLLVLSQEMTRLDGLVIGLNKSLKAIGGEASGLRKIALAGDATGKAMERASRHTAELERRLAALKLAGNMPIAPMLTPLPGGGGGGRNGGGWHGGNGGMHGGNIHMGPGGIGIGTVGMAAGSAFLPLAATAAMIWGGHAAYESAKSLDTERQRFKLFGLNERLNREAFDFVGGMKSYGVSEAQNMKNFREAQGVFRESGMGDAHALEAAKMAAPVLAKIDFASSALSDEQQARLATSNRAMMRYVEMSGGLDPEKFKKLADFGFRMVTTSGGTVDWEQLRQFKAISGVAGQSMSEQGLAMMEPLISELKGGGAGTGLRTAFNRLNGIIKIPNQVAHELVKQGLWDESKVEFNSNGGIKRFNGNPFKSAAEFQDNFPLWYERNMLPMYDRMKLDPAERDRWDAMLLGGTGGRLGSLTRKQLPTLHRSWDAQQKALGIDDAVGKAKNSLSGQEHEFSAAWTDFKTQFGTAMLPTFTAILKDGAAVMRLMGDFMRENKGVVDFIKNTVSLTPAGVANNLVTYAWKKLTGDSGGATGSWGVDPVRPGATKPVQVQTSVHLDGRKVGEIVSKHQAKDLGRPATGARVFDGSMSPRTVGATGSW